MKCQKSRRSSLLMFLLLGCILSSTANSGERDDLYESGLKAYESNNHVLALKNLYAFYVLNEKDIDDNPDFKKKLLDRISTSESILKISFAASSSGPLENGAFRIITRQRGGFVTGTGREIEDLLNNKTIDLDSIRNINRDALTMPSSGRE